MDVKRYFRGPLVWVALVVLVVVAYTGLFHADGGYKKVSTSEVVTAINSGNVDPAAKSDNLLLDKEQRVELRLKSGDKISASFLPDQGVQLANKLNDASVRYDVKVTRDNVLLSLLISLLPIGIVVLLLFFFMNQMQGGGNRVMNFGKSKAKLVAKDTPKTTFADVAGADEAIEELQEIKEFLENPAKFQAIGAKIPKGVLLYGPPGTGKTLLARAVAGEAGVPFYAISGSDFVEMFVGVGASRVRDLFEQAKNNAPAILFVDEMDGFDVKGGVILIAATNRPDILDPALLRPGRFDRQIVVDRPDLIGRKAILAVHAKGKPMERDVDLEVIARRTPGFTGADLANTINEAALLTARQGGKEITTATLEESIDRVMAGPERKSRAMSEKEKKIIAYHEGGHALVAHALPNSDPVHKVTILPRGRALGYTMTLPVEDKFLVTRSEMIDQLAMLLGGRTAEEMVFHEPTTGASNDIEKATGIARAMVTEYGMSDKLGALKFGQGGGEVFLGRDVGHQRDYSEEVAAEIDAEVRGLIEAAHDEAWEILVEFRGVLDELVLRLMDKETIGKDEVSEIFAVIDKRPSRGSYIGFGKRLPSTEPPVLTPRELALLAPEDLAALSRAGRNGGALVNGRAAGTGSGTTGSGTTGSAAPSGDQGGGSHPA